MLSVFIIGEKKKNNLSVRFKFELITIGTYDLLMISQKKKKKTPMICYKSVVDVAAL